MAPAGRPGGPAGEPTEREVEMPTTVDAVKRALANEVRSQAFYRLAAEVADRDDTRLVFLELGDLEGDHARELANRVTGPPLNLPFDAHAYIDELEDHVKPAVPPEDEKVVRSGNVRDVLKLAKRLEVEARENYRDLARRTEEPDVKAFCEELSRLEDGHIDEIRKLELSLDMAEDARPAL
jgi:rubrerythrin